MALRIEDVHAVEILDSQGGPALGVRITLSDGASGTALVPAARENTAGPRRAVGAIVRELTDTTFADLADLDETLGKLDTVVSTDSGAITGLSMATARALAVRDGVPLWRYLARAGDLQRLPVPYVTMVNGGRHAGTALDFEEFMVAPLGAPSVREAMRAGADIHGRLRTALRMRGLATSLGDDGGHTADVEWPERVLELMLETVVDAGYAVGGDGVTFALRVAAGHFWQRRRYRIAGEWLTSSDLVSRYEQMVADFPLSSIEDALAPDDREGWAELTRRLGDRVQLVGGEALAIGPDTAGSVTSAVARHVANAMLIRLARLGTVTQTLRVMRTCRDAGYAQMIACRSCGTNDAFIADLAVATGCGQLCAGAPAHGERVAKYNRLLEIEAESGLAYG